MPRWCKAVVGIALAATVGAVNGSDPPNRTRPPSAAPTNSDSRAGEDPFPIRRLRVSEAQLPEVLKQLEPGPVVRLPRTEFEARVSAAARVVADSQNHVRVTDARYRASLVGGNLVGT